MKAILNLVDIIDRVVEFNGLTTGGFLGGHVGCGHARWGLFRSLRRQIQASRSHEKGYWRCRGRRYQRIHRLRCANIHLLLTNIHIFGILIEQIGALTVRCRRRRNGEIVARAGMITDRDRFDARRRMRHLNVTMVFFAHFDLVARW